VFLKRGTDGEPRRLSNEDALIDLLDRHGFDILDCGSLSAFEIARRALDCRVVVAVEGSHLAHGAYTVADGGAFLVIQPPNRFALPYKEFADSLDLRFGFVVGEPEVGGFSVNLDEIRDMLDRLLS
jgi:capsular polysaccharide biosynthesis protein